VPATQWGSAMASGPSSAETTKDGEATLAMTNKTTSRKAKSQ
jgi:hypothetical protein